MALATIDLKPGFIDRTLVSEQPGAGALVRIANPTPLDLVGREIQTISFSGEMGIFGEGASDAETAEKTKSSNDATNGHVTITPITFYISYRFPKKFLSLFGVDGYTPTANVFRAGQPQTMLDSILAQPYQAGILEQYRHYVNRAISRAVDYVAVYGVNPATKAVSKVARVNGYLLDKAVNVNYTPGAGAQAADAFRGAVRQIASQGDTSAQGITNSGFLTAMADGKTDIGSPAEYASQIPLIGDMVSLGGVTIAASNTMADTTAATSSGKLADKTLDGIFGDFRNRFLWGAIPLGGIEVFDSGNPDNNLEGDLGAVNKVMLRTEVAIGWGFLGGTNKFAAVTHTTGGTGGGTDGGTGGE